MTGSRKMAPDADKNSIKLFPSLKYKVLSHHNYEEKYKIKTFHAAN